METQEKQQAIDRQFIPAYQEIITKNSGELEIEVTSEGNEKRMQENTESAETHDAGVSKANKHEANVSDKKQELSERKSESNQSKKEKKLSFQEKITQKGKDYVEKVKQKVIAVKEKAMLKSKEYMTKVKEKAVKLKEYIVKFLKRLFEEPHHPDIQVIFILLSSSERKDLIYSLRMLLYTIAIILKTIIKTAFSAAKFAMGWVGRKMKDMGKKFGDTLKRKKKENPSKSFEKIPAIFRPATKDK